MALCLAISVPVFSQVNGSVQGRVTDTTGAVIPSATVTAVNTETGVSRSTSGNATGDYSVTLLPPGDYTVTAEHSGFQKDAKKVHLDIGATAANVDFSLAVGQVTQRFRYRISARLLNLRGTMVSSVIDERKIQRLARERRRSSTSHCLLRREDWRRRPARPMRSLSPVTKLSFAGQNIHYNFIAVDGADNIPTASGVQKPRPPPGSRSRVPSY